MSLMHRYQVYLDPRSVEVIDLYEKESGLSRSQVIRLAIDSLSTNLSRVLVSRGQKISPALDSLINLVKTGHQRTNFATHIDDTYLSD